MWLQYVEEDQRANTTKKKKTEKKLVLIRAKLIQTWSNTNDFIPRQISK